MASPHINATYWSVLPIFCHPALFRISLVPNEINIALEFDTVGRSRLLYAGNGVALIILSAAKPTLRGS
jgi:hypothetical protein